MPSDRDDSPRPTPTPPQGAEPFARRQVQWGRPPQTVFRAGPLPRGDSLPPLPAMPPVAAPKPARPRTVAPMAPPAASRGDFFSGSLIPRARPAAPEAPTPARTTPEPVEPPARPLPDMTVRPLPPAEPVAPRPEPTPVAPAPDIFEESVPVETSAALTGSTLAAASARRKASPNRLALYAGIAAVVVAGVGLTVWLTGRDAPTPVTGAVTPPPIAPAEGVSTADETTVVPPSAAGGVAATPVAPAPAPVTRPAAPAPSRPATTARPAPARPARAPTRTPAASPPAPSTATTEPAAAPPPPAITTAPLVVTVPPAGPPPTAAQPAATDPDAPIVTRPQPLE